MEAEIEEQMRSMALMEHERQGIKVGMGLLRSNRREELGLACKLMANRAYNMGGLLKTLRMWWKGSKGVELKAMEGDVVTAFFGDKRDRDRVLEEAPWLFDDFPVMVVPYEDRRSHTEIEFKTLPVWAHVHDMPLGGLNMEVGKLIGAKLGKCLEVHADAEGFCLGKDLRVQVELDITNPIPRGVMVKVEGQVAKWHRLSYERLPIFCAICGCLGHEQKFCERYDKEKEKPPQYVSWLRRTPQKRRAWRLPTGPPRRRNMRQDTTQISL